MSSAYEGARPPRSRRSDASSTSRGRRHTTPTSAIRATCALLTTPPPPERRLPSAPRPRVPPCGAGRVVTVCPSISSRAAAAPRALRPTIPTGRGHTPMNIVSLATFDESRKRSNLRMLSKIARPSSTAATITRIVVAARFRASFDRACRDPIATPCRPPSAPASSRPSPASRDGAAACSAFTRRSLCSDSRAVHRPSPTARGARRLHRHSRR